MTEPYKRGKTWTVQVSWYDVHGKRHPGAGLTGESPPQEGELGLEAIPKCFRESDLLGQVEPTQEPRGIAAEERRPGAGIEEIGLVHHIADGSFAEWVGVVAPHDDVVHTQGVDQCAQGGGLEDDRVDTEPANVLRRWKSRSADDVVASVPGVLQPTEPEGERATAVREADPQ